MLLSFLWALSFSVNNWIRWNSFIRSIQKFLLQLCTFLIHFCKRHLKLKTKTFTNAIIYALVLYTLYTHKNVINEINLKGLMVWQTLRLSDLFVIILTNCANNTDTPNLMLLEAMPINLHSKDNYIPTWKFFATTVFLHVTNSFLQWNIPFYEWI